MQVEQDRRASILDEEIRQRRVHELAIEASCSGPMSGDVSTIDGSGRVVDDTTDGIILVDADTKDRDQIADPASFEKLDPSA